MLRNKLDLTICSCFWHLSLVQKFLLWSVKKQPPKILNFTRGIPGKKCHFSYRLAKRSQLCCLSNREHYSLHFAFLRTEFAKWSTSRWQSQLGLCSFFFFFSLQLETIFVCITELLSPVESGLVFLRGQGRITKSFPSHFSLSPHNTNSQQNRLEQGLCPGWLFAK